MKRVLSTTWCLAALMLLAPDRCDACSCAWAGPFLTVAPRGEAIIRAKVLGYEGRSRGVDLSMNVAVLEVLQGIVSASRLRVWGDNGAQCRPYVSGFPVDTEWVFAVTRLKPSGDPGGGEFFINGCGEYWARVEAGSVVGRLTSPRPPSVSDVLERMTLEDLRTRLRTAGSIPRLAPL